MRLERTRIAVVTEGAPWAHRVAGALRAEGGEVVVCAPDRDLWFALTAEPLHAIVLADAGEVRGLCRALAEEPHMREIPAFLLRPLGVEAGPAIDGPILVEGEGAELDRLIVDLVASRRRRAVTPPPPPPARGRLATVVHDVRVLLGIVIGFGANLRDELAGPAETSQHARKIVSAAQDASALVEQLLALDASIAPEAQPRVAQRAHLDLVALVEAVVVLFQGHARHDRGVAITLVAPEPVHLWGDSLQLKQVVTNLVVNAIKFTPEGGRVKVTVRLADGVEAQGPLARRLAEIVVSDTGPGIPPAERQRVFERGARLARDARLPGSGIGLSVVKDLVQRHGGAVVLRESPEGGAEFVASLPLDLRGRPRDTPGARDAVVVVRDERGLERVLRTLKEAERAGALGSARKDLRAALEACRAVVIVPGAAGLLAGVDDERGERGGRDGEAP
jgi:signal transduction histidine kinase